MVMKEDKYLLSEKSFAKQELETVLGAVGQAERLVRGIDIKDIKMAGVLADWKKVVKNVTEAQKTLLKMINTVE